MKIVVLPMDERPPNYQLVREIGAMHGQEVTMPEVSLLGRYMNPGDCPKLSEWLKENQADVFVVSVDMLVFGGLIASREEGIDEEDAVKRLELIKEIRSRNPRSRILLSSIARRASISVSSAGSRKLWKSLNDYMFFKSKNMIEEAKAVKSSFPKGFFERYYELRKRNHMVNRTCIELIISSIADVLVLAQEDTIFGGPQVEELRVLADMVEDYGLQDRVFIHNGADEVVQELLSLACRKSRITADIVYDTAETAKKVMDFEDREFEANVRSHTDLVGIDASPDSETGILIAGSSVEKSLIALESLSRKKKRVMILDVFRANGSNPEFVESFMKMDLKNIWGYSAWNTASNSLGTLLSVVSAASMDERDSRMKIARFYVSRLLDDHLYQGVLREKLESLVQVVHGNEYKVSTTPGLFGNFRNNLFLPAARDFLERHFYEKEMDLFEGYIRRGSISVDEFILPWDRTFECRLETRIISDRGEELCR